MKKPKSSRQLEIDAIWNTEFFKIGNHGWALVMIISLVDTLNGINYEIFKTKLKENAKIYMDEITEKKEVD